MPQDNTKLDKPAFAGESQTDRAARAAASAKPVKCSDTCTHATHAYTQQHSETCPRYIKPIDPDDLPF